jgi:carboxymethylenebutenolidase
MYMSTERMTLIVSDGSSMGCYVARPDDTTTPRPGLIIFQEAFGVNAHIRDITERFAREGYVAIAPELFHRTAPGFESDYEGKKGVGEQMGALTDEGLLADAQAAYEWLTRQPFVRKESIGAVGFCMGGRTAFLANAELPLSAAVSFYGGGIAHQHLSQAADQHGPIMLLWGGKDAHISADDRQAVEDALEAAQKEYVQVVFSYADHGFFCDARASYSERAAREAWPLVLEFLKGNLAE